MAYNKANRQDSDEEPPSYTFPRGTQYPPSLPRNVRLRLHPHMNDRVCRPPIAPKPRPFHGFTPTGSLAPLAKAPLAKAPLAKTPLAKAPTEAPSFLSHIPGPIPSHGVILLANAPSSPFQGVLPLVTPAHGEVASGVMQIKPATPTGSHLIGQCVMSTHTETAYQQMQQRKLLPIHPAPRKKNPTMAFSTGPQTGPWLPWRIRRPPTSNPRAKAREAALAPPPPPTTPTLPPPPPPHPHHNTPHPPPHPHPPPPPAAPPGAASPPTRPFSPTAAWVSSVYGGSRERTYSNSEYLKTPPENNSVQQKLPKLKYWR